jgi:hypothetical protein
VQVGAFIAVSVERLLAAHKNILEIRKLRRGLADKRFEDELAGVDTKVNGMMDDEIRAYVNEVVDLRFADDDRAGRAHELDMELLRSLRRIANRIDDGYNFDVRAGEPEPDPDGGEPEMGSAARQITDASPNLKYINLTGQSILSLPEGKITDPPDESESATDRGDE